MTFSVFPERPAPEKRLERISANRKKSFKCLFENCGRDYNQRALLIKHSLISHALILRNPLNTKPSYKQLHNFCLETTPITRASRIVFMKSRNNKSFFKNLARNPVRKPVNLNSIINECKIF